MAAKILKFVYLSSKVSYEGKYGADLDNIKIRESMTRSGNSLEV